MIRKLYLAAVCASITISSYAQAVYPKDTILNKSLLELPTISADKFLIVHTGYTSCYNTSTLIPDWVAYELTHQEVLGEYKRKGNFSMDPSFPLRQAMREDYSQSGWDKGHMAPAADMKWSERAMYESFYFTNICPQNHFLNEKAWLALEQQARAMANKYGELWIICGPIVNENKYGTLGGQGVVIPDAFFKAFLAYDGDDFISIAFVLNNNDTVQSLAESAMTVDELESKIGLDLFHNLSKKEEKKAESQYDLADWNL